MESLIIGHTTDCSANIWVRGGWNQRAVKLSLEEVVNNQAGSNEPVKSRKLKLNSSRDYTAVAHFKDLHPETQYKVNAYFSTTVLGFWPVTSREAHGEFRTFPGEKSDKPFSFLLGSCNLSPVTLNNLGALLAGVFGLLAAQRSLSSDTIESEKLWKRILWTCLRRLLCFVNKYSTFLLLAFNQLKQPGNPILGSTFHALNKIAGVGGDKAFEAKNDIDSPDKEEQPNPAFMIHAGDQIYFDFPFPERPPELYEYRLAYREAWFQDGAIKEFLSHLPQYMILDDHEIIDQFPYKKLEKKDDYPNKTHLSSARQAYVEYVDSRQPSNQDCIKNKPTSDDYGGPGIQDKEAENECHYYCFQHGDSHFFVMDTRTQRQPAEKQMIGKEQMEAFKSWLCEHKDELKFVVTSVPFIAEPRDIDESKDAIMKEATNEVSKERLIQEFRKNSEQKHNELEVLLVHEKDNLDDTDRWTIAGFNYEGEFCMVDVNNFDQKSTNENKLTMELSKKEKEIDKRRVNELAAFILGQSKPKLRKERDDKWCGVKHSGQREEIMRFIYKKEIDRLIFLTGDMHCSYHAVMQIGSAGRKRRAVLHELAGGPIHQLQLARRKDFHEYLCCKMSADTNITYSIWLEQFQGGANSVMRVNVINSESDPVIEWTIEPLATTGVSDNKHTCEKHTSRKVAKVSGRISFEEKL